MPATAGALAVHVNVPLALLHAELLAVRLVAIDAGLPVNAVPFTVANVMMIDWVLLDTYCGLRLTACAAAGGTEIVKLAVVAVLKALVPLLMPEIAGVVCEPPLHAANKQIGNRTIVRRIRFLIGPGGSRSSR
jgi:hypothetical protein